MTDSVIQYDHINKRVFVVVDDQKYSVPVTVTGTKHATISRSVIAQKVPPSISPDLVISALKKHRNNKGNKYMVVVED